MHGHHRWLHSEFRKLSISTGNTSKQQTLNADSTETYERSSQRLLTMTQTRSIPGRLRIAHVMQHFGTWNVKSLRGKAEVLAGEMEHYRLSFLAVTKTHLSGEGEMVLETVGAWCSQVDKMIAQRREWDSLHLSILGRLWDSIKPCYPWSLWWVQGQLLWHMPKGNRAV